MYSGAKSSLCAANASFTANFNTRSSVFATRSLSLSLKSVEMLNASVVVEAVVVVMVVVVTVVAVMVVVLVVLVSLVVVVVVVSTVHQVDVWSSRS